MRYTAFAGALLLWGPAGQAATIPANPADVAHGGAVIREVHPKVDLRVLVVTDGSAVMVAYQDRLAREGIPYDVLDLGAAERPVVDDAYLTTEDPQAAHGNFQGVILPSSSPVGLSQEELEVLHRYEASFGVRQITAFVRPGAEHGMQEPYFSGAVDGLDAQLTETAEQGPFSYLSSTVRLDDNSAAVTESYAHLAVPQDLDGRDVTALVTVRMPGSDDQGLLTGVFDDGAREELFNTFASNRYQQHFNVLAHGQLEWLTRGTHLGYYGNFFSVHSDDVLMANAQWSSEDNCTSAHGCAAPRAPAHDTSSVARMTAIDVEYLRAWQQKWGFPVDLAFNGSGSEEQERRSGRPDALLAAFRADLPAFRWINHTYSHQSLGCVPRSGASGTTECSRDESGAVEYVPLNVIRGEIRANNDFASRVGIPLDATAVVTGEHSGLASLPHQPEDNPHLAPALAETGVRWIASDASREKDQRSVGQALTVPRYPMNIFFNAATRAQQVDEYNWLYTSRADGGSGMCEDSPGTTTCIEPLPVPTGFETHIVPTEAELALGRIVGNDPRPHYAHQSNQTGDRLLYPVLERILAAYRDVFAASAPLIVPTMAEAGAVLRDQAAWAQEGGADAVYWMGHVYLFAHQDVVVPVSMPAGARSDGDALPESYAGKETGWLRIAGGGATTVTVGDVGFGSSASAEADAPRRSTDISAPQGPGTVEVPPVEAVAIKNSSVPNGERGDVDGDSGGDPDSG